jgi:ADP-ribose pyrophosphatase YjhB (NUDIX family)
MAYGDFCTHCGARLPDAGWPRTCDACKEITYRNPIPVGITLLPVLDVFCDKPGYRLGLLVVRRAIPPAIGRLALPGGYMEMGETWEHACAREVHEETRVVIEEATIKPFAIRTSPTGMLLIFGLAAPIHLGAWLRDFTPNSETQAIDVIWEPTDLAFPIHADVAARYFASRAVVPHD